MKNSSQQKIILKQFHEYFIIKTTSIFFVDMYFKKI